LQETQLALAPCFQLHHHCVVSAYYVNLIAINPKREEIRSVPVRVLVDAGSELSWLPLDVLASTGIQPRRKRMVRMADGRTMDRDVGFCILESEGFVTNDEVVFAQPGDMHLLGVRTLEGFGVTVDPLAHRLVATVTLAATNALPI
jgi:predicted aspartyl protease